MPEDNGQPEQVSSTGDRIINDLRNKIRNFVGDEESSILIIDSFFNSTSCNQSLKSFISAIDLNVKGDLSIRGSIAKNADGDGGKLLLSLGYLIEICDKDDLDAYDLGLVTDIVSGVLLHTKKTLGNKRYFAEFLDVVGMGILYEGLSSLIIKGVHLELHLIKFVTDLLFYIVKFDITSRRTWDEIGKIYELFFGRICANLGSIYRICVFETIKSTIHKGDLPLAVWGGSTLLSPIVGIVEGCEDEKELLLIDSILTSLAQYNISILDLKNTFNSLRSRIKRSDTGILSKSNQVEDMLQGFEYFIAEEGIKSVARATSSDSMKYKEPDSYIPPHFDTILNFLCNISFLHYEACIYSLYMSGSNSGVAMHLLPNDANNEINNISWTCCVWINPIIDESDLREYYIMKIETAPNSASVTLSICSSNIIIRHEGQVAEIQHNVLGSGWKMLTMTKTSHIADHKSSDVHYYKLRLYVGDTIIWKRIGSFKGVIFIHSIYLLMNNPPSSGEEEMVDILGNFRGLMGYCMFSTFYVSKESVRMLYDLGPDHSCRKWDVAELHCDTDEMGNSPDRGSFIAYLHPRKIIYNMDIVEHVSNTRKEKMSLSSYKNAKSHNDLSDTSVKIFRYVEEYRDVAASPYIGVIFDIYESFSYKSNTFAASMRGIGGAKVLVPYLEGLDRPTLPITRECLKTGSSDDLSQVVPVKVDTLKSHAQRRACLLFKLLATILEDRISNIMFFESTSLCIIQLILGTNGKNYICPSLLHLASQISKLSQKFKRNPKYLLLVESNLLFNHLIWYNVDPKDIETLFTHLRFYIYDELKSDTVECYPRVTGYSKYIGNYLLKLIFLCQAYVNKFHPLTDNRWQETDLFSVDSPDVYSVRIKCISDILRDLIENHSKYDATSLWEIMSNVIIPENDIPEISDRIEIFLRHLILKCHPNLSTTILRYIFDHCNFYVLFQICVASPSLVPLVLDIIFLLSNSDESSDQSMSIINELYLSCTHGINLKRNKMQWLPHYLLLQPIETIVITERLAYSLAQIAFGIHLTDVQVEGTSGKRSFTRKGLKPSIPYTNLLLNVLRINIHPQQMLNVLCSIFVSHPETMEYLIDCVSDSPYRICSLLVKNINLPTSDSSKLPSTLGDLAEHWIVQSILRVIFDIDKFCKSLQTIISSIHCIYSSSTALLLSDKIIMSLASKISEEFLAHDTLIHMLLLTDITFILSQKDYLSYIASKLNKSLDSYNMFITSTFMGQSIRWDLMYYDAYMAELSDKYIAGLKYIVTLRRSTSSPKITHGFSEEARIKMCDMIANCSSMIYSKVCETNDTAHTVIEEWFDPTVEYMYILYNVTSICGYGIIDALDMALENIIRCISLSSSTDTKESIKIKKCMIGIVENFISMDSELTNKNIEKLNDQHMKLIYVYTKLLTFFGNDNPNYGTASYKIKPIHISAALTGGLHDVLNLIMSKDWRNYIKRHILPELTRTFCTVEKIHKKWRDGISDVFFSNARNMYREFLEETYVTIDKLERVDKIFEDMSKNRARMLAICTNMHIYLYSNSRVERPILYRNIFCESGIWTRNTVKWFIDSRIYKNVFKKRLIPSCGTVERGYDNKKLANLSYSSITSNKTEVNVYAEREGFYPIATKVKSGLALTTKMIYNITGSIPALIPSFANSLLESGVSCMERLRSNAEIQCQPLVDDILSDSLKYSTQVLPVNDSDRVRFSLDCEYIYASYSIMGVLHVTSEELIFVQKTVSSVTGLSDNAGPTTVTQLLFNSENFFMKKAWLLEDIEICLSRRRNLRQTALEFFFKDKKSCFLNFPSNNKDTEAHNRSTLLDALKSIKPELAEKALIFGTATFRKVLESITDRWANRLMSNFEYIMYLNIMSGRSYNDFTQYPVFPWIISDYESDEIDINDDKYYRNLSKPVGALNEKRLSEYISRSESLEDSDNDEKSFLYGGHYSSWPVVVFYLIRLEPFANIHRSLQDGKFDSADRLFYSISRCWKSVQTVTSDVKELIPEFFYMPEFLVNINKYDFGKTTDGVKVNDVILPKWAKTPYNFINTNYKALESEYTSANIHNWIDLVWGYKQSGKEAKKANNLFHYLTYEGSVDLDSLDDIDKKNSMSSQIRNFGQTPSKLFNTPHKTRIPRVEPEKITIKPFTPTFIQDIGGNEYSDGIILIHPSPIYNNGTLHDVATVTKENDYSLSMILLDKIIPSMDFSQRQPAKFEYALYVISSTYSLDRLYIDGFSTKEPTVSRTSSRKLDINDISLDQRSDNSVKFKFSPYGSFIALYGLWDGRLIIEDLRLQKQRSTGYITHVTDMINGVCFSENEKVLFTCSRDSKIYSWDVDEILKGSVTCPLNEYIGHTDSVEGVYCDTGSDILVSSSKGSTIIVHSYSDGRYIYSLTPPNKSSYEKCKISSICIAKNANYAMHTVYEGKKMLKSALYDTHSDDTSVPNDSSQMGEISLYNINGMHISSLHFYGSQALKQVCYNGEVDKIILLQESSITFVSTETLETLNSIDIPTGIDYIHPSFDGSIFFMYKRSGNISILRNPQT